MSSFPLRDDILLAYKWYEEAGQEHRAREAALEILLPLEDEFRNFLVPGDVRGPAFSDIVEAERPMVLAQELLYLIHETCHKIAPLRGYAEREITFIPFVEQDYEPPRTRNDVYQLRLWLPGLPKTQDDRLEDLRQQVEVMCKSICEIEHWSNAQFTRRLKQSWRNELLEFSPELLLAIRDLARCRRATLEAWTDYWTNRRREALNAAEPHEQWLAYMESRFADISGTGISKSAFLTRQMNERNRQLELKKAAMEELRRNQSPKVCPNCGKLLPALGAYKSCFHCGE